jgi:ACS family hexuronate transporter-like MFS transporter
MSALFARLGWGVVSDFLFQGRRKIVLGMIGASTVVVLSVLAWLPAGTPGWAIGLLMIVIGASVIGWNGINMTFVAELAGPERSATAAGLNQTLAVLASMIAPPLFGLFVDQTRSYALAFQSLAFVMILALIALMRVGSERKEETGG